VTVSAFASAGCGLSIGPQVETRYVLIHTGKPLEVLENRTVKGRVLDGTGAAVTQDVGGWVMMPPDHWDAVKRALERAQGAAPATEPPGANDGK